MLHTHASRIRPPTRTAYRLLLAVTAFLASLQPATAQLPLAEPNPPPVQVAPPVVGAPVAASSLGDYLQQGLQSHPRIAAARASLAAAEDGRRALENLQVPALLAPELPIRRRQAALGVTAAAAGVEQAERETAYAVTRTYFSVLYAREQERVARSIIERLNSTYKLAKQRLDDGAKDVNANDVSRAGAYVRLAEVKRIQATQGVQRALAALREALGQGCGTTLEVPPGFLPEIEMRATREEIVAAALARRAELVRAGVFVDAACLEIEAQGTGVHKKMETFAAGSDIHAILVPQGVQDTDYRPGALPPEMPTLLAGCRSDRVKRAQSLHSRALSVAEVARNLIVLEAEDAFLRWQEASLQIAETRVAATTGDELAKDVADQYRNKLKVKVEEVINAQVLASQARAQYNEALYRQIIALADLERITSGAFCARLVEATAPQIQPVADKGNEGK